MKTENILAVDITSAGENASYDACCKRLIANRVILAWIMKSCLEEYRDIPVDDIAERYIEGNPQIAETAVNPDEQRSDSGRIQGSGMEDRTIYEGTVTYDIRFLRLCRGAGKP